MTSWPEAILVADDDSPGADAAFATFIRLATCTGARLSILHVKRGQTYPQRRALGDMSPRIEPDVC